MRKFDYQLEAQAISVFFYVGVYGGKEGIKMQTIADAGGVANLAGGGIAGLSGGDKSGRPPESGPASQGLRSLIKNGRKL